MAFAREAEREVSVSA